MACYTIRGLSLERSTKDWNLTLKWLSVQKEGLFLLQQQMRKKLVKAAEQREIVDVLGVGAKKRRGGLEVRH